MLIGLTGYAQSGKDTAAKSLHLRHDFQRVAFADKLKDLAADLNPILMTDLTTLKEIVDRFGWDQAKRMNPAIRGYLQALGTHAREQLGEDVWIRAIDGRVKHLLSLGKNVVITDVRHANESDYVRSLGGSVYRIVRPDMGPVNDHATELNTETIPVTSIVMNDGTPTDMAKKLDQLVKG